MKKIKTFYFAAIISIIPVAVLILSMLIYAHSLQQTFLTEIKETLIEISGQSAVALQNEINGKLSLLVEIAANVSIQLENDSPQNCALKLKETSDRNNFKRMGIISADGTALCSDNVVLNLAERAFFIDSMAGASYLSSSLTDKTDGEKINVYSTPIYRNNEIAGVLFATCSARYFNETLSVSMFNGAGYTYVIQRNGDIVANSSNNVIVSQWKNLFSALIDTDKNNEAAIQDLEKSMALKNSGYITFHNDISKYMYCRPLNVNDWYLISVVPRSVADKKLNEVMIQTVLLSVLLVILFLILLGYLIKSYAKNKQNLMKIAYVDDITGGSTHAKFLLDASAALSKTHKNAAIASLDIDDFKLVNDTFGHKQGNDTIRFIWSTLNSHLHAGELMARRSADVFTILFYYERREELLSRLDNICSAIQQFQSNTKKYYPLLPSVGIFEIGESQQDLSTMITRAEMAKKLVKGNHQQLYAFYDDKLREKLLHDKAIENEMEAALQNHDFQVFYQPKYSVTTKEIIGAEALVRWIKPDGTLILPYQFIPLFERNGFITSLDKYMFTAVCKKQKEWLLEGLDIVPVSVNLSRLHLFDPEFTKDYQSVLDDTKLPSRYVQLEITESAMFENTELLCSVIQKLHSLGIVILMDDFGTGYSSMMMLKSIPVDVLKLDKNFVDDIGDERGENIISTIISLAHLLHMTVTAEGVENESQYEFLRTTGCDDIQGYYFARPMPEAEFKLLLSK